MTEITPQSSAGGATSDLGLMPLPRKPHKSAGLLRERASRAEGDSGPCPKKHNSGPAADQLRFNQMASRGLYHTLTPPHSHSRQAPGRKEGELPVESGDPCGSRCPGLWEPWHHQVLLKAVDMAPFFLPPSNKTTVDGWCA